MHRPTDGPGLQLVPGAPDGSGRPELSVLPRVEPPPTAISDEDSQALIERQYRQRLAEEFAGVLDCLRSHGITPIVAHVSRGGFAIVYEDTCEDAEPVSPVPPEAGVHEPPSPSATP